MIEDVETYIVCEADALRVILHQDGVIQIKVENVTTFVCLSHLIKSLLIQIILIKNWL